MPQARPWTYLCTVTTMCETCLTLVPAKVIVDDARVWYLKRCAQHGVQRTLISSDYAFWRQARDFVKPGDLPAVFHTRIDKGCPYDCGLCPDHEQHSCLSLIEVTDACGLGCTVCFARSTPRGRHRPLAEIEALLDQVVESEGGKPDIVQISGGEPTEHPDILAILRAAKARPIRHVMLNTNGVRLAEDPDFATALAELKPGFEVYLQFDSLRPEAHRRLRGRDLTSVRQRALDALERHGISTTLVAVMERGVNDDEAGDILRHALSWSCVRGVTFQPLQAEGRTGTIAKDRRMLVSDIRRAVIGSGLFAEADVLPLPCNPESVAIAYALRTGTGMVPVTGMFPRDVLLSAVPNSLTFDAMPGLREKAMTVLSMSAGGEATAKCLGELLCCLPKLEVPATLTYDRVFRVAIVQFLDRFNFELGAVKRSCIHVAVPGKMIPLDTWNLLHRTEIPSPVVA